MSDPHLERCPASPTAASGSVDAQTNTRNESESGHAPRRAEGRATIIGKMPT
jgi:hypothetical protein